MKRFLSIIFIIILIFSLGGCTSVEENDYEKHEVWQEQNVEEYNSEKHSQEETIEECEIVDTSKSEYTYDEMVEDLNSLNKKYDGKMHVDVIGTTYDDRNIYQVILGNENAKKHILIHAGIHGCEYLNSLLLMKQLEYYLKSYDSEIYNGILYKDLFENTAFHIIPMVNPDGIAISQIGIDGINDKELKESISQCYKRDLQYGYTRDDYMNYLRKWKANARGVDINRNFDADWDSIHQASYPSFENYKGITYESELETISLVKLTNKYNFVETISYHSSGELIYWDYKQSLQRDACSNMADIAARLTKYEKGLSDSNYSNVVSGGYKDWASSKVNNPIPSITIETGKGQCPLKISEFDNLWESNLKMWADYAYLLYKVKEDS